MNKLSTDKSEHMPVNPADVLEPTYKVDYDMLRDATSFDSSEVRSNRAFLSIMGPRGVDKEKAERIVLGSLSAVALTVPSLIMGAAYVQTACETELIGSGNATAQVCEVSNTAWDAVSTVVENVGSLVGSNSFRPEQITVVPTR